MTRTRKKRIGEARALGCFALFVFWSGDPAVGEEARLLAQAILDSAGVGPGPALCVHVGCGDGALARGLAENGSLLVHGLCSDREIVAKARRSIRSKGLYGRASVEYHSFEHLPYADNLANLVVVDDLPKALNAGLSLEEVMRVVCPDGVAFLGKRAGAVGRALSERALRAELAKAGLEDYEVVRRSGLWAKVRKPRSKEMDDWPQWRHGADRSSVARDTVVGPPARLQWIDGPTRGKHHNDGPYAMVSAKGRIFYIYDVSERFRTTPSSVFLFARDAYNGLVLWKRPIQALQKGSSVYYDPRLLVAVEDRVYVVLKPGGPLVALDAATGRIVKTYEKTAPREMIYHQGALVLLEHRGLQSIDAAMGKVNWKASQSGSNMLLGKDRIYMQGKDSLLCLELATGKEQWEKSAKGWGRLCFHRSGILGFGEKRGKEKINAALHAVSAGDGSLLWSHEYRYTGHCGSPYNIFPIDGLLWVHEADPNDPRAMPKEWVGLDPATGTVKKRIGYRTRTTQRCAPDCATERFILCCTMDFMDLKAEKHLFSRATRMVCRFGYLPANGLVYTFPTDCSSRCFPSVRGVMGLASNDFAPSEPRRIEGGKRLELGPAARSVPRARAPEKDAWPTYRHDPQRSGSTKTRVSPNLKLLWQKEVGGRLTSPSVAEGLAFVASSDFQVHAFEARTGRLRWSFTTGAPLDEPPTVFEGLCLFGSHDGWAYCVRASDGRLVWRFRAAPFERRIVTFGRLGSAWPVLGGVLVDQGTAYFAAGRSSQLDQGVYVSAVEPKTGKLLWQTSPKADPAGHTGGGTGSRSNVLGDILVKGRKSRRGDSDESIYMWNCRINPKDGRCSWAGRREKYLRSDSTLLDREWANRTRWSDGTTKGQILVFDRTRSFGVQAFSTAYFKLMNRPEKDVHKLFAAGEAKWSVPVPVRMRAMVLAGETVFAAGPPDPPDPSAKHGELWAFSAADGKKSSAQRLEAPPVYDGMAAAYGRLYISTEDGRLLCFGEG